MEEEGPHCGSMAALLFSRNKAVCGSIRLVSDDIRLIEVLSPEDVRHAGDQYAGDIRLIYIDISKEADDGKYLLERMREIEWLRDIPFFVICREGDMMQYAAAISCGARDLITVPVDVTYAKRRITKFLSSIKGNEYRYL